MAINGLNHCVWPSKTFKKKIIIIQGVRSSFAHSLTNVNEWC